MKLALKLVFMLICSITFAQTNLLNTSGWTTGTGSAPGFIAFGMDQENIREIGIGPYGNSVLLWKAVPDVNTPYGGGGWHTGSIDMDYTKTYRFTVWTKKINSQDGSTFFAFSATDELGDAKVNFLDGSSAGWNPYFYAEDLRTLNDWYLLVGYVHNNTYTITSNIGGIYDGLTGYKMSDLDDFKFQSGATKLTQKVEFYDSTNIFDNQFFYGPTLYEVNGQEPTIQELINAQPNNNGNPSTGSGGHWTLNNQDVYYNTGNVGIGTTIPDSKLTVKGSIHSEEVKVDLSVPAPDYVFETNYNLTPLEKLQQYIKTYKYSFCKRYGSKWGGIGYYEYEVVRKDRRVNTLYFTTTKPIGYAE